MINKVLQYINGQKMFNANDCVVAGVSGGADSVCLLLMLLEVKKTIPMHIHVVHINHMIREDATSDAQYVENLCIKYNLPFTLVEKDVETIAKSEHISTEEAGRNIRYQAFNDVLDTYKDIDEGHKKIAIAHNKNDCCETFLFNLFRGSSLKGLCGIKSVRDNIVRPLMCLERAEIEKYLEQNSVDFCIDSTNLEDNYTRNKIRHHILDTAKSQISPAAISHISNACEKISEAYDLIKNMTDEGFRQCVEYKGAETDNIMSVNKQKYDSLHATIQGYVIMEVLSRVAGSRKDLESVHVDKVKELMCNQTGKSVNLPYNIVAQREYEGIIVRKKQVNDNISQEDKIIKEIIISKEDKEKLLKGEKLEYMWNGDTLTFSVMNTECLQNIPQNKYTKWFDYGKIKSDIHIRTRKKGDYLTINSSNQKKMLKAYFITQKVPREDRDSICLIAEENHIMWITGERISNYYKIDENTNKILQISISKEEL